MAYACEAIVRQYGGRMCSDTHCSRVSTDLDDWCHCRGIYEVNKVPCSTGMCCPYNQSSAYRVTNSDGTVCYCCCSCFAWGTPIAVPDGYKPIETFLVGDQVLVADAALNWSPRVVQFSDGTGTDQLTSEMIEVTFAAPDGGEGHLVVTPAHLFYLPDGTLIRADRLVPGDELARAEGGTAPVLRLQAGLLRVGVHHIATTTTPATSVDGHLLNSNGIVTADYALQVANIDRAVADDLTVRGHDDLPPFGTREYVERYGDRLDVTLFWARPRADANARGEAAPEAHAPNFIPFTGAALEVPDDAQYFLNRRQARRLARRAPMWPVGSGAGVEFIRYLFQLHSGFFPDVVFYYDQEGAEPNAYSFRRYGKSFVVVTGALGRLADMGLEGMAVVIAHELGHLYGGEPRNAAGYSCEGAADFAGLAAVMRKVWLGPLYDVARDGVDQIRSIFAYIQPKQDDEDDDEGGDVQVETDAAGRCAPVTLACRLDAMEAGMMGMPLPYCAGGPDLTWLEVEGATAAPGEPAPHVTVTFNVPVNAETAMFPENYILTPAAEVRSATVDTADPARVVLVADVVPGKEYLLRVQDVLSANNEYLYFGRDIATFTLHEGGAS